VGGYPGEYAIIARRSGQTWYVAGINGRDEARQFDLTPLSSIVTGANDVSCFLDGNEERSWQLNKSATLPTSIHCLPRGGFVLVINH
jgi:hypothetical protein